MEGDKLIFELGSGRFAVPTKGVAGIVELERLPFLPGRGGFVTGVISFRNEPVAVVDVRSAMGDFTGSPPLTHKVVVAFDKGRYLGLDIGDSPVSFVWNDEIAGKTAPERGLYTEGRIRAEGGDIDIIDFNALFNEAARMLSTGDHA